MAEVSRAALRPNGTEFQEVTWRRRDDATSRRHDDETMHIHWEESATTKTAPFRLNPLGAGGFGPRALSFVGHDVKMAPAASVIDLGGHSSLRASNPKTPARGPRDFCHGLLSFQCRSLLALEDVHS